METSILLPYDFRTNTGERHRSDLFDAAGSDRAGQTVRSLYIFNSETAYNLSLDEPQKTLHQEHKIPRIHTAPVHCHAYGRNPHAMTSCQVKLLPRAWRTLTMVSRSLARYGSVTEQYSPQRAAALRTC